MPVSVVFVLYTLSCFSVVLQPAGLVTLCPGENATFTYTIASSESVVWEISTVHETVFLNDPNQQPVTRGIFMLRVVSVVTDPNGGTSSVTSTATTSDIQPVRSDGLVIRCWETESVNLTHANAKLRVTSELLSERDCSNTS